MKCRSKGKDSQNVTLIITSLNLGHFSHDSKIKRYQMVMSVFPFLNDTFVGPLSRLLDGGRKIKAHLLLGLEASPPGYSRHTFAKMF